MTVVTTSDGPTDTLLGPDSELQEMGAPEGNGQKKKKRKKGMSEKRKAFWKREREAVVDYMKPKHKTWKRLLSAYRMDFEKVKECFAEDHIVKISRFYPLTRQLVASINFADPAIFIKVLEATRAFQSEILSRVANESLRLMHTKREMRQIIFDALYCDWGWIKEGVNPPGDDDAVSPYVANDAFQNGMTYTLRRSPFCMFPDPQCPPQAIDYARYIMEKIVVPHEWFMKDDRYDHKAEVQPMSEEEKDEWLTDIQEQSAEGSEEEKAIRDSRDNGDYVILWEIHDRVHKRLITFDDKFEHVLEDVQHPFLAGEPVEQVDPFGTNRTVAVKPTGGYLVQGGFPYVGLKFDMSDKLYGEPMMAYVEDEQNLIVESVTRRRDNLKRMARITLARKAMQEEDPEFSDILETGKDGEILWVDDVHNSFAPLQWGPDVPPDQLGIESDMRHYEDQILQVNQLASGSGEKTATEAALIGSFGQLNREWLQDAVATAYETITYNTLRIMADVRYLPQRFLVNVARDEEDPVIEAVTSDMLKARFSVQIEATSMRPLFEELEQENTLKLVQFLTQFPEVPRKQILRLVLGAFRVPDKERLMGGGEQEAEARSAQLENEWMIMRRQDPGVLPAQDHRTHLRVHGKAGQDPYIQQVIQSIPDPQQQQAMGQQFAQLLQQHMQQHQQILQQLAQGGKGAAPQASGKGGPVRQGETFNEQAQKLESTVRSNAQDVSQAVAVNPGQN